MLNNTQNLYRHHMNRLGFKETDAFTSSTCTAAKQHTYFYRIVKMVFRAIRCHAHCGSGAVWCANNEGQLLQGCLNVIYFGDYELLRQHPRRNRQREKPMRGCWQARERPRLSLCLRRRPQPTTRDVAALAPTPCQLPSPLAALWAMTYTPSATVGQPRTQAECSFIKVGMQHTCRRSGKGVQIHRAKIQ